MLSYSTTFTEIRKLLSLFHKSRATERRERRPGFGSGFPCIFNKSRSTTIRPRAGPALHLKHINVFAAEGFQSPGSLTHMRDVCRRRRLKEGGTKPLLLDPLRSPRLTAARPTMKTKGLVIRLWTLSFQKPGVFACKSFTNCLFWKICDSFLGADVSDIEVMNQYCQSTRDGDLCLIQVTEKWRLNNKFLLPFSGLHFKKV